MNDGRIKGIAYSFLSLMLMGITIVHAFGQGHPPYLVPQIHSATDYQQVVYIDPSAKAGNGTIASPFNSMKEITPQPNTAYLLKRGTILDEHVAKKWEGSLLGAYGSGDMPIIANGIRILEGSHDFTLRDIEIRKPGTGTNDVILAFHHKPAPQRITVAFCRVIGVDHGRGYPYYAIEHAADSLVFFNNEVGWCRNNGWWLNAHNVIILRNWFHNINLDGVNQPGSTGDIIQSTYFLTNSYIAGNIMDRSNSMWKHALMINVQETGRNIVVEYNTIYAPKQGAGGAAVRWTPGRRAIFRKNLILSVDNQRQKLTAPFDTWNEVANQPEPYGIRDNHIIADTGGRLVAYDKARLHPSNRVFPSLDEYHQFLQQNPGVGQYGSDIDTTSFFPFHH